MPSRADIEAGRAFVRLFLKNDMSKQLVRSLNNAKKQLRSFGQSTTAMGKQLAAVGVAGAAPFALSARTFASFDDAMREVAGVTQATGEDFGRLTAKAKELGASTSYTANQVALLMAELGRAGFEPRQIEGMTGAVLALSRATKTEASQSAGIMAAALRQFNLEAGDAARVADVLTAGANKSFNTLESIGDALTYAGPIASDFNMSLEDTVAILGTLGNVGIQGSNAGTAIRRMLTLTGADAQRLQKIFGVSFVDAAGNARPLVESLQDVADATKGMGTAERSAKFKDAFGILGITGASALSKNITGARELRRAIGEAGGTAKKTADMMDSGLGGAGRVLMSALEGVQIAVGEALAPVLSDLAKRVTNIAQFTIEWVKANKGLVVAVAATAVGVTAFGVALIGVGTAAAVMSVALGGLASIAGAVLSPVGLVTAAVVGAAAAFLKWSEAGQAVYQSLSLNFGKLLAWVQEVFGAITDAMSAGDMQLAAEVMWAGIKVAWTKGIGWVLGMWGEVAFGVLDTCNFLWTEMIDGFWGAVDQIVDSWKWLEKSFAKGIGWVMAKLQGLDPDEVMANLDQDYGRQREGRDAGRAARDKANQEAADKRYAASEAARQEWTRDAEDELEEARKKLAAAIAKTRRAPQTSGDSAPVGGDSSATGARPTTGTSPSVASHGVALTATYSAAAARISGFQPGGGPEEKMAGGIAAIDDNTKQMIAMFGSLLGQGEVMKSLYERFLAGWRVR